MKFTVVTPLVRMEPGNGLRSYSVGDVIEVSDAEMKDLVAAGYVRSLAQPKVGAAVEKAAEPVVEKATEPVVKKNKDASK